MRERCVQVAGKAVDEPSEDVVAIANQQRAARRNPFARIALFIRQVVAELRKVVTPTRQELVKFTLVVLGFVVVVMAIVYGLDLLFTWVVDVVFGVPS